jgi:DNA-binding SARP family transcriptional activator
MSCHALLGRRARALRWYELCRNTLLNELNVAPSDETVDLANRISAGHDIRAIEAGPNASARPGIDQTGARTKVA